MKKITLLILYITLIGCSEKSSKNIVKLDNYKIITSMEDEFTDTVYDVYIEVDSDTALVKARRCESHHLGSTYCSDYSFTCKVSEINSKIDDDILNPQNL